jgi:hypothetical protein
MTMTDRRAVTQDNRYPGSKALSGLAEWIIEQLPPHVYYVEPFAGKGGVFRSKPPALRTWLIDQDPEIVAWWDRLGAPGAIAAHGDGIRWCELAAEWGPVDLLLYCDPPYLPETRVKLRLYRHEMSLVDHTRLLQALLRCRCAVAISGYASRLYDDMLAGWRRESRWVITRGGVLREEILWLNRLPASPGVAMEYSALGGNWRERERVNRKAERWAAKLQALPPNEQRAVMLRLLDVTSGRCSQK